jgi:hypothetical protein
MTGGLGPFRLMTCSSQTSGSGKPGISLPISSPTISVICRATLRRSFAMNSRTYYPKASQPVVHSFISIYSKCSRNVAAQSQTEYEHLFRPSPKFLPPRLSSNLPFPPRSENDIPPRYAPGDFLTLPTSVLLCWNFRAQPMHVLQRTSNLRINSSP